ncbi:MAG: hypothetical protein KKF24_16320, partial [Gammaproteobacteria bacterium]|nr:hypothetical protein [Gammaproteobacteria bacterium]MBU1834251.1 hypothetical protein [Gammaproteobacteria bacterium]
ISRNFIPGNIKADMLFIAATQTAEANVRDVLQNNAEVWRNHVGQLNVHSVNCHHQEMFDADVLEQIGPLIAKTLKA